MLQQAGARLLRPKLVKGFQRWRQIAVKTKHSKASMSLEEKWRAEAREREMLAVKLGKIAREYQDQRQLDEVALLEARKNAKELQEQLARLTNEVSSESKANYLAKTALDMKTEELDKSTRAAKAAQDLLAEQQKHAAEHLKKQLAETRGTLDKELNGARTEIRHLKQQVAELEAEIMRWKVREVNHVGPAAVAPKIVVEDEEEAKRRQKKGILGDVDFDESRPLGEQIKEALQKHAIRVLDLFREWDKNGDGQISKKEFRQAMPLLGMDLPTKAIDELFDQYDPDRSGVMEFAELQKMLRKPAASSAPSGGGGWGKAKSGGLAAAKMKGLIKRPSP
uniref:EF-hand domain-containing protein n=1 Tax=Haptolina brevifila TaxID=156173 RepID=A0A7S2NPK6_9EUKA